MPNKKKCCDYVFERSFSPLVYMKNVKISVYVKTPHLFNIFFLRVLTCNMQILSSIHVLVRTFPVFRKLHICFLVNSIPVCHDGTIEIEWLFIHSGDATKNVYFLGTASCLQPWVWDNPAQNFGLYSLTLEPFPKLLKVSVFWGPFGPWCSYGLPIHEYVI